MFSIELDTNKKNRCINKKTFNICRRSDVKQFEKDAFFNRNRHVILAHVFKVLLHSF